MDEPPNNRSQTDQSGSRRSSQRIPLLDFSIGNLSASSSVAGYYNNTNNNDDSYRTASSTSTISTPSNTKRFSRQRKTGRRNADDASHAKVAKEPVTSKLLDLGRSLKKYLFKARGGQVSDPRKSRIGSKEQAQETDREQVRDPSPEGEMLDLHGSDSRLPQYDYSVYIPEGVTGEIHSSRIRPVRTSQVKAWETAEILSDTLIFERGEDEEEDIENDDDTRREPLRYQKDLRQENENYGEDQGINKSFGRAMDMNQINEVDENTDEDYYREGDELHNSQSFDSVADDAIIIDGNEENEAEEYDVSYIQNQKGPPFQANIYSGDTTNDSQINTPTPIYRSRYHQDRTPDDDAQYENNILKTIPSYTSEETNIVVEVFRNFQGEMGGPISKAAMEEEKRAIDAHRTTKYIELEKMYLATRSLVAKRRIQVLQKKDIFLKLFSDTNRLNKEYITNNTLYSAFDSHSSAQKAYLEDKEEVNYLLNENSLNVQAMNALKKKLQLRIVEHPVAPIFSDVGEQTVEELNSLVKLAVDDIHESTIRQYDETCGRAPVPTSSSAADRSFLLNSCDPNVLGLFCFSHLRSCLKSESKDDV